MKNTAKRGGRGFLAIVVVAAIFSTAYAASPTGLTNGVPETGLSGSFHSTTYFYIDVPAGQTGLEVKTWGGTGDVDVYVNRGSLPSTFNYDDMSGGGGTDETVTISDPAAGRWYILLRGADQYQNVTLRATYEAGTPATPGEPDMLVTNLSGGAGSEAVYLFQVPAYVETITFAIHGGTGDCDMYIKQGTRPTTSDYDYRPTDDGNNESTSISGTVDQSTWYVLLVGDQAYAGVTFEAHYYYRTPEPPEKPDEGDILRLTPGVSVMDLAGKTGSEQFFSIDVPTGAANLVIRMSGGSGDADLYLRWGDLPTTSQYDIRPYLTGNNEQVTVNKPNAGTWYIMIRGYHAFSGVTLLATFDGAKPDDVPALTNGVAVPGLAGGFASEKFYKIDVPADQTKLEIGISGSFGDADLYVRVGALPTVKEWDYRPYLIGSRETVALDKPKAGTYYILIRGYLPYAGLTLLATYGPAGDGVKVLSNCVPMAGLAGAADSEVFFKIDVPAGQSLLRIATSGGLGDADLYVKKGDKPSTTSWDYYLGHHGNDELLEVTNPAPATWYIMVRGYQDYSGVTLKACFQDGKGDCGCGSPWDCDCTPVCDPNDDCVIIYF